MRPGGSGSPGITSSSPVKNRPRRTLRYTGSDLMPTEAARPVSCGSRRLPAARIVPPLRMSLPVRRIHSPGFGIFFTTTASPSVAQNSCITIASAPGGIGAPVKMRAAVPAARAAAPPQPAMMRCATFRRVSGAFTSARRTRVAVHGAVVHRRHVHGRGLRLRQHAPGGLQRRHLLALPPPAARRRAGPRAPRRPKAVPCSCELQVAEDEGGDAHRASFRSSSGSFVSTFASRRHGDDMRVVRVQHALARLRAPDFQLRDRRDA